MDVAAYLLNKRYMNPWVSVNVFLMSGKLGLDISYIVYFIRVVMVSTCSSSVVVCIRQIPSASPVFT